MKFKKLLPLVLVAPLLASCGGGVEVKEPEFKAYSNKVEYEAFVAKYAEEVAKLPFYQEAEIGSFEMKGTGGSIRSTEFGKNDYKDEQKQVTEGAYVYDKANGILEQKINGKGESTAASESLSIEQYSKEEMGEHSWYKVVKENETNYQLNYDHKHQVIRKTQTSSENLDAQAKYAGNYTNSFDVISPAEWATYTDAEKAAHSFYQDGLLFTVVFEYTFPEEDIMGDSAVAIGKETQSVKQKAQIDLASGHVSLSSETTDKKVYNAARSVSVNGYRVTIEANEAMTTKEVGYQSVDFALKDVTVEQIDTSNYYVFENFSI